MPKLPEQKMPESNATVVAVIGIGSMGRPMAARLVNAGLRVLAYDVNAEAAARFCKEVGGEHAANLASVGQQADLIITMLPTSAIVSAVLFDGADNLCAGIARRTVSGARKTPLIVDMSSGVPSQTVAIAEQLSTKGMSIIDAPVSGGVKRAITGELAIMVGGEAGDIDFADPVLRHLGKSIVRTGKLGTGQAMKSLNNMASAAGLLIAVEILMIGSKFGLDPAVMVDVLNVSSGKSNSSESKLKQFVLSRSFGSGFSLDLMVKDLGIAMTVARETHTPSPLAALTGELWGAAQALLGPGQDHTAITRFSELLAKTTLSSGDSH